MLVLYSANEENFENCGLGILRDAYNVYINRKINSIYELIFDYPSKGFLTEKIQEFMIVKADNQLFRIKNINKKRNPWSITANHIFFDLNDNFLEDVAPTNQNGTGALNWILDRTVYNHKFKGFSDIEKLNSARYVRKNVVNVIIGEENSLVNRWNGEIDVDNFEIKLLNQIGEDRGLQLTLNKNISGVDINIKTDNLATKLLPKGSDELLLPEKYVDSPLINNYPFPIIREIEISEAKVSDEMTLEQAYELMRNTCKSQFENGIDKPTVNIKVDFVDLSKTIEYKKYKNLETVYLGDTVSVFLSDYNINTKLRIISTQKNVLKNRYEKLELGDELNNLATQQSNVIKNITSIKSENKNLLNEAKDAATEMLKNALGGYVVKTQSELFIMDTNDTATAEKVWRWNLNGLGYSSTGINGPYETAITQDGNIVADFIKTGTMSVERIEGLAEQISIIVQKTEENTQQIKNTITTVEVMYALSDSASEAPISGWSTVAPEWVNDKYMWQKTVTIQANGTSIESKPTCISGASGKDGTAGADGKSAYEIWLENGNTGTEEDYLASLKGDKGDKGDTGEQGPQGEKGETGAQGETGVGVNEIIPQYYLSTSNTEQIDGEWNETQPEWTEGTYVWTRTEVKYTDGSVKYTTPVLAEAMNQTLKNTTEINEKYTEIKTTTESITNTVSDMKEVTNNLDGSIVELEKNMDTLQQNVNGLENTLETQGGSNLLLNSSGLFDNEYWDGTVKAITNTEIQNNFIAKGCFNLQNGSMKQTINVINGSYYIGFKYQKLLELANCRLKINDIEIELTEASLTEVDNYIEVSEHNVTIELISDTNDACLIGDIIIVQGAKQSWSSNMNEIYTATVKIGIGLEIISNTMKTKLLANADGVRIVNTINSNTVAEFTDKGIRTDEIESNKGKIAGLLMQQVGNQVWLSNVLGGGS